ncbi:ABC transporter permease [Microbacterium sp. No. 7]|uniref:ABC transporter permease n=1 Tax=Microbacterium sp. No. 7 TaxID=1714373 RepID=UPI0009E97861|nr:SMP-30/gluconolactonase/LRE family protein [Microbacterium sp. No. 7]
MAKKSAIWKADAYDLTGTRWSERLTPARTLSDLLKKRWMEGAVPLTLAIILSVLVFVFTPVGPGDAPLILNDVAERGLLAIALTIVLIGGGIDLSIGSIVGVTAMFSLVASKAWGLPVWAAMIAAVLVGGLLGAVNGFFIAKLKMRPFITTLVTLIAFGGVAAALQSAFSRQIVSPANDFAWKLLGKGALAGIPIPWIIFFVLLVVAHVVITRSKWGWWVTAVGSDRRSARRNGIPIDWISFSTYLLSGLLAGLAGVLTTARLGRSDPQVGQGWELVALTAVVLGGVSLSGGRGSVLRAAVGVFVVQVILQATIVMGLPGSANTAILALALLGFAILDLKWGKYRAKTAEKLKIDPGVFKIGPLENIMDPSSKWAVNYRATDAAPIGLGRVDGPEDMVIDDEGSVYCPDRRGWIWKFQGPDPENVKGEVWARTGGMPIGMVWDQEENLTVAVGGMGVYRIDKEGTPHLAANKVKRTRGQLFDDSALKFADDLDVAPDGAIYTSDFSTRVGTTEYILELVEFRPNGRIVRIDKDGSTDVVVSNYLFPNGIATSHAGDSILIASTAMFRIDRLWISGPKQGQLEPVATDLPGYPDNINRASDGNYWATFVAMRSPMSDLLVKYPKVRRRMTRELPTDSWAVPQLNVSCVFKFNEQGEILDVIWDGTLENYPMITSAKEHNGFLYLGGVHNNRVGKMKLDPLQIGDIDPRKIPGMPGSKLALEGAVR